MIIISFAIGANEVIATICTVVMCPIMTFLALLRFFTRSTISLAADKTGQGHSSSSPSLSEGVCIRLRFRDLVGLFLPDVRFLLEADDLPFSSALALPFPVADDLPFPSAVTLPFPVADDLPFPSAVTLPFPVADDLPFPSAVTLPFPVADDLPFSSAVTLPFPVADDLPSPSANALPLQAPDD